jgi:hypothetical protein
VIFKRMFWSFALFWYGRRKPSETKEIVGFLLFGTLALLLVLPALKGQIGLAELAYNLCVLVGLPVLAILAHRRIRKAYESGGRRALYRRWLAAGGRTVN